LEIFSSELTMIMGHHVVDVNGQFVSTKLFFYETNLKLTEDERKNGAALMPTSDFQSLRMFSRY
jgi:hypothetical protein